MITINGIPVYAANVFDAETGIFKVAICDNPAIQSGFQAFGEEKQVLKYSVQDEEQRIVLGCLMRSSYPIYRRNADGFEYFIVYTSDTIKQMASKWLASQNVNNINLNHQEGTDQDGIYLMQAFIKDSSKGIDPVGFQDIEDGSLFAQYKVMNDDVWAAIKEGTYVGFSLEGMFGVEPMNEEFTKQEQNNNNNNNKENKLMSKLSKIKETLKSLLLEFGEISTDGGVLVFDGDELVEGMSVRTIDEQGNEIEVADGDYKTEDKKIIVIAEGKVVEIKDDEAEVATDEPAAEPENQENAENEPSNDEPTDEPDERDARIAELETRVAELEAENEELRNRIAELEKEPASPSAEEAFSALEEDEKTPTAKMRRRGYKI